MCHQNSPVPSASNSLTMILTHSNHLCGFQKPWNVSEFPCWAVSPFALDGVKVK